MALRVELEPDGIDVGKALRLQLGLSAAVTVTVALAKFPVPVEFVPVTP